MALTFDLDSDGAWLPLSNLCPICDSILSGKALENCEYSGPNFGWYFAGSLIVVRTLRSSKVQISLEFKTGKARSKSAALPLV